MKFRWSCADCEDVAAAQLANDAGVSPLLAQCLLNRGFDSIEMIGRFLEPRLKNLADPFLLPGMGTAVDRILSARQNSESIVIFGDYDVDGVSATAILVEVLSFLGCAVDSYLPSRLDEGYGLSSIAVENCFERHGRKLVVAVDCGSTSAASIEWLKEHGCDVIVVDHHQVSDPRPCPVALVNPQLANAGEASFRELCSAGLAFKLAHALMKRCREVGVQQAHDYDLRLLLDLVAMATIADVVPLTGENRIFVSAGLARLNQTARPGLRALIEAAAINGRISGYEVGFQLAPRLNAAGRLENAEKALRLVLSRNNDECRVLARELDEQNRQRQRIERSILDQARAQVEAKGPTQTDYVLVEGQDSWHVGVVGIVAARLVQAFHRPALVFGGDGEKWRGSGRSIDGFDLAAALRECGDLLLTHGGHAMAAGLSIRPENIGLLRNRINEIARRTLKPEQLQPSLRLDARAGLADLTLERLAELGKLQQTGMGNPPVHLFVSNVGFHRPPKRMGEDQKHAKFWITDGQAVREAVWWNASDAVLPEGRFDLAFVPQINEFDGARSVQLKFLDWRAASSQ
jgi:single-stranded-DNA-specific exonuclease